VKDQADVGFSLMLVSTWTFVGTRLGLAAGGLAAALVALSGAGAYAYEGRPYGLVLGCAALAALAWQRAGEQRPRGIWVVTLALTLALALSVHYYAVLLLAPLALGEGVRALVQRRIDTPVWIAIVSPLAMFIVWWPLIQTARAWSVTFWARPSLARALDTYPYTLDPLGLPLVLAVAVAGVTATMTRARGPLKSVSGGPSRTIPLHELVFLVALLALPIIGWTVARFVTGAWHERYVISMVIGFAGLIAVSVHESGTIARQSVAAIVLAFFAAKEGVRVVEWRRAPDVVSVVASAAHEGQQELPMLVSDGIVFLQLAHYAPTTMVGRLWYPLKSAAIVARTGTDTESRAMERLARLAGLHVEPLPNFVAAHPRFMLFGPKTWVIDELLASGATLELKSATDARSVYEVRTGAAAAEAEQTTPTATSSRPATGIQERRRESTSSQ
jgi:hypothetical protein